MGDRRGDIGCNGTGIGAKCVGGPVAGLNVGELIAGRSTYEDGFCWNGFDFLFGVLRICRGDWNMGWGGVVSSLFLRLASCSGFLGVCISGRLRGGDDTGAFISGPKEVGV